MVLRAVTYRIKSGFSIKARPERSRMGVERQHIKTPSHGDLSGICLIFGIGFSIIPNKIAIGDFVRYDPFDYAQDMFINYELLFFSAFTP